VRTLETSAVTLGEHGAAPRFTAAVRAGTIRVLDATCPAIHAALQATEKGLPFIPIRGLIGSDVLAHRGDWRVIDNPFQAGDRIVALPAIRPDVALFHAPLADRHGNVWIGRNRELMTVAHASATTLVTVEEIVDRNLLEDPVLATATIPDLYVSAVAAAPRGASPLALAGRYPADGEMLARYAQAARTEEGFRAFLDEWLTSTAA
jgi:glutaconate CoA-transferase, subunit A